MTDETNPPSAPVTTKRKPVATAIGWIVGSAVGFYFGLYLLIPAIIIGAIWWITIKTIRDDNRQLFVPAFSVQIGQLLMHGVGLMYLGKINEYFIIDVSAFVVSAIGLIWLILKPGLGALILLGIIHILRIVTGVFSALELIIAGAPAEFPEFGEGVGTPKGILLHAMLSALAIALMILAYLKSRKSKNAT